MISKIDDSVRVSQKVFIYDFLHTKCFAAKIKQIMVHCIFQMPAYFKLLVQHIFKPGTRQPQASVPGFL